MKHFFNNIRFCLDPSIQFKTGTGMNSRLNALSVSFSNFAMEMERISWEDSDRCDGKPHVSDNKSHL